MSWESSSVRAACWPRNSASGRLCCRPTDPPSPTGVGDGLVGFGSRVEVEQRRDDFAVDLAAVVVAGQGRADGRGHGGRGGVVGQLAGHEVRDLGLVPVGHQLAGDEGQHLGLVHS